MSDDRPPQSYPPETVLNIDQLAEWLQISPRTVERQDIPCFYLGRKRRYRVGAVIQYLDKKTR